MFGRKRRAEPTPLLAKRSEMPPALSTTNLHCSPWQLREKRPRSGGRRRAAAVTWQREQPDGQPDGRTNKPSSPSRCPGGGDGRARGGGRLGCQPGDPHPGGGRRRAGAPARGARLNCAHWALPSPATGRAARLPGGEDLGAEPGRRREPEDAGQAGAAGAASWLVPWASQMAGGEAGWGQSWLRDGPVSGKNLMSGLGTACLLCLNSSVWSGAAGGVRVLSRFIQRPSSSLCSMRKRKVFAVLLLMLIRSGQCAPSWGKKKKSANNNTEGLNAWLLYLSEGAGSPLNHSHLWWNMGKDKEDKNFLAVPVGQWQHW